MSSVYVASQIADISGLAAALASLQASDAAFTDALNQKANLIGGNAFTGNQAITGNLDVYGGGTHTYRNSGDNTTISLNAQSGAISAASFAGAHSGSGASLTSLPAGQLTGSIAVARIPTGTTNGTIPLFGNGGGGGTSLRLDSGARWIELDVYSADQAYFASNMDMYFTAGSSRAMNFRPNSTQAMKLTSAGRVLINSTAADNGTDRLQVDGSASFAGVGTFVSQSASNPVIVAKGAASQGILQAWTDNVDAQKATLRLDAVSGMGIGPTMDLGTGMLRANNIVSGQNQNTGLQVTSGALRAFGSTFTSDGNLTAPVVLVGGASWDGVTKVQVTGGISASTFISSSQINTNTIKTGGGGDWISVGAGPIFHGPSEFRGDSITTNGLTSTSTRTTRSGLTVTAIDNTHATRKYRAAFSVWDTAEREFIRAEATGGGANVGLFGASSFGSGIGVVAIPNAGTDPTGNPSAGGILHASSGAGRWRSAGGAHVTFAPNTASNITGSRSSGAALLSLLTYLASLGYITDGSSA